MQNSLPKLNFPTINLRARRHEGSIQLWDTIRKCYIVLTPEEWVRRHVIGFLTSQLAIPPAQIILEHPVLLNGQRQRADVVVINSEGEVKLMVECKAHDIKISQSTLDQAVRYNSVLNAKYIMLTNGLTHHLYEKLNDEGGYRSLNSAEDMVL